MTAASPTLTGITEDQTNPTGTLVSTLLGATVTDVDTGAVQGIAVTSLSGSQPLGGQLQHFTNTRYLKIVNMTDRSVNSVDLQNNQLLDENGKPFAGAAEADEIS